MRRLAVLERCLTASLVVSEARRGFGGFPSGESESAQGRGRRGDARGRGRGRGRPGSSTNDRSRERRVQRGNTYNSKRPLRDAHLDGASSSRYNPNRKMLFTPEDELNRVEAMGKSRDGHLIGELRDPRASLYVKTRTEITRELKSGTLTTRDDPDGVYKPSHRPRRLTMPINFEETSSSTSPYRVAAASHHESDNLRYVANEARPAPQIPSDRDFGGRARRTLEEARGRTTRDSSSGMGS